MISLRVVAGVAVSLVVLAGCGGAARPSGLDLPEYTGTPATPRAVPQDRSADEVVAGAKAAVADQESVTVSGTTTAGDRRLGGSMTFVGDAGTGTFSFGGGIVTLLYADGKALYKGDSAIYSAFGVKPRVITRRIGDRWIVVNSTNPRLVPLRLPADRAAFLDDLVDVGGAPTLGDTATVDGRPAIEVAGDAGSLLVDADTLRPIRRVLPGDGGDGIGFAYDGDAAAPTAPAADQIVDLGDLR
jgi:hypothetical protein